ncbi:hypothetical protein [Croceibacterium ferulae]|nr:hypothetical protein [Croceibacterium ferulae]
MTQMSDIARQSLAAIGALAITATLLFGSFAPPAQDATEAASIEVQA